MIDSEHIVYRDDCLIAINKPSGLLVHRGWDNDDVTALSETRRHAGRWVYPVHRLDRGTSGLVLFTLEKEDVPAVQSQFNANVVFKRYVALVRGHPEARGLVDHAIPKSPGGPRVSAQTRYERVAVFERYALVSLQPLTGRLHQLRRHMKHLFHPIVGDVKYGDGRVNREFRARFDLHRLALHAEELRVEHPRTGEVLELHAPLPPDLSGPFRQMGFPV